MNKWLKGLLGCGCLSALLFAMVAWFGYQKLSSVFTMDASKVAQLGTRLSPSMKAPDGFVGMMGMDTHGFSMAMFMDQAKGRMVGVMSIPADEKLEKMTREEIVEEFHKAIAQNDDKKVKKVLKQVDFEMEMGSIKVPAFKRHVQEDGKESWEYFALARDPKDAKRYLGVLGTAPANDTDSSFFLNFSKSIEAAELTSTPQSRPSPEN